MSHWTLTWDRGHLAVRPMGGMMAPAEIELDDGRRVSPFLVAPWANEHGGEPLPPMLAGLRGDWTCIPFGLTEARTDLLPEWIAGLDPTLKSPDPAQHGAASHGFWQLDRVGPRVLSISFEPPAPVPIRRIERTITVKDGSPDITVTVRVFARAACDLPWGLHPTFQLPQTTGAFEIDFEAPVKVSTYPGRFELGVSKAAPGQVADTLKAVPLETGGTVSFAALPLPFDTEELVVVNGHGGKVRLTNHADRYVTRMEWDEAVFPSLVLWISNRGRTYHPWNGRFLGVGVEPVCAPFELGYAHAMNPASPFKARGIATSQHFDPETPLETTYRFRFAGF